jgi:hypothetical protein
MLFYLLLFSCATRAGCFFFAASFGQRLTGLKAYIHRWFDGECPLMQVVVPLALRSRARTP